MPPKREKKEVPLSDRITRSRALSEGQAPQEERYPDQEPRPLSRASSTHTLVADSSDLSVWSIQDTGSEVSFTASIDVTSTQVLRLPHPSTLPLQVIPDYSPTEFDTTGFFHSAVDMSDNEDQGAGGGQRQQERDDRRPVIPPVMPGISPDIMMVFQMLQQQSADAAIAAERRFQQQRADDLKRHEDAQTAQREALIALQNSSQSSFKALADEVKRLAVQRPESARPSTIKLPAFDLEKDRDTFKQWRDRWNMHLRAHKIHLIEGEDERRERCLTELTAALSNDTLKWIANRDFTDTERNDAEALIQAFEDHIRESTNPTVTVVELFTMKRTPHETADHLNARINEKLNQVDFAVITDIRDYFGMTATIIANDPVLRKRMYLDKVDTYAKAHAAVKADEQASIHSKMVTAASSTPFDLNYVSSYKKNQKATSQAAQPQRGGYSSHADRGAHFQRGGTQGGYTRGRGGYNNQGSSRQSSPDRSFRDRGRSESRDNSQQRSQSTSSASDKCESCGKTGHPRKTCWAFTKDCLNCGKLGHISPACRQPQKQEHASGATASFLEGSLGSVSASLDTKASYNISLASAAKRDREAPAIQPLESILVTITPFEHDIALSMEVIPDTGANVTAIPLDKAKGIKISQTKVVLRTAGGNTLKVLGSFEAYVGLRGNYAEDTIYVVDGLTRPLLSRTMLKELGLIHKEFPHQDIASVDAIQASSTNQPGSGRPNLQEGPPSTDPSTIAPLMTEHGPAFDALANKYRDLFDGKCTKMKSAEYHIELEKDVKPISYGACRSVPDPYLPALRKELDGLMEQGIIEQIDYSTPWLHPIVVVPKKGTTDIRLCVDFSKLNRYVIRPVNPQPTPWETVRNLPKGIKHFAVFDALKGYHQIPLTDDSKDLTAFMTPFGRFRYLRLAFGLNSAGDVFTLRYGNAIDKATDGLRATEDTLIRGSTTSELVENTSRFFAACRENGITLNMRKVQWDKKEVLFGGFLLDPTGYRLDPTLNKALSEFPTPTSPTDVRSFFGLANQLCNFSDEIADVLAPIKSLLKKGVMFQWLPEHQTAFEKAREHLASPKTLAYYCPRRSTRLIVDASRLNGLGFVLKQCQDDNTWRAVQAGSRFLSSAETRYAMVELECLAIAWACEKCRMFVDGLPRSQFQVWTDHAPLVPILNRQALPDIANRRLQRLKMKVDHLTFETVWIKGKENVEADALSRHPCAQATPEDELDEEFFTTRTALAVISFTEATSSMVSNPVTKTQMSEASLNVLCPADRDITDDRLRELRSFASDDATYKMVVEFTTRGFPNLQAQDIPVELQPFYKVREELTTDSDGFLVRNDAFVVPQALVPTYLKRLLSMHQAAPKMLARARRSLWWPFMARDINLFSKSCEPCEVSKPSNPAELVLTHEPALYPFQYIHMDIGHVEGRYYLVIIDQYSGYPHVHDCGKTATTKQVIDATVDLIQHFSVPEVVYSDGGPQFIRDGDFDVFCREWGIRHILSSPYMPRSNGIAENGVKEMKKLIRANLSSNGILNRSSAMSGLQMYRNTPRSGSGESPAMLIFGHDIRDSLPCRREHLLPPLRFQAERRLFDIEQGKLPDAVKYGPKRELPLIAPNTLVRIQNPTSKKWDSTGTVINFGYNTREYLVSTGTKSRSVETDIF